MKIQKGPHGGPDVSNATETNQAFVKDAAGVMKATCTGAPHEKKALKLSADQSAAYKTVSAAQVANANGSVGWGDEHGNYHPGGKSPGQGAQVANYAPSMNKGASFPSYTTAPYLILEIGADGKPITVTLGEGLAA
jgi:hypothetical protein